MKIVRNTGRERVIDLIGPCLALGSQLDMVTHVLSLFAFGEFLSGTLRLARARIVLPPNETDLLVLGTPADRSLRNSLRSR